MREPARFALMFLGGFALCAGLLWNLESPSRNGDQPRGAVPRHREAFLVLKWLAENRADAAELRLMVWWPPLQVSSNPISGSPSTLVHVVFQSRLGDPQNDYLEDMLFYVIDDQVLGCVRNGEGGCDPRITPDSKAVPATVLWFSPIMLPRT